jgi:hypothetical protein
MEGKKYRQVYQTWFGNLMLVKHTYGLSSKDRKYWSSIYSLEYWLLYIRVVSISCFPAVPV